MSNSLSKTAVSVTIEGKRKRLFGVREAAAGLVIMPSYPRYAMLPDEGGVLRPRAVPTVHLTVHPSLDSPDSNTITHRYILDTGEQFPQFERHVTRAIKARPPRHAVVLTHHCEDMRSAKYDLAPSKFARTYDLGPFEPAHFQLLYQILVTHRSAAKFQNRDPVNSLRIGFGDLLIIVLWTFISYGTVDLGNTLLLGTYKEEDIAAVESDELRGYLLRMPEGIPPERSVGEFQGLLRSFMEQFINRARLRYPEATAEQLDRNERLIRILAAAFRHGTQADNPSYQRHLQIAKMRTDADPVITADPNYWAATT